MPNRLISDMIQDKPCLCVPESTKVRQVARIMNKHHVSAVMVVGRRQMLIGICTERDLVSHVLAAGVAPDETPVGEVMTPHPRTISPDKQFGHALHMMYEGGFRHVPVVDSVGRPLGMVSARDALDMDASSFAQELVRREEITLAL